MQLVFASTNPHKLQEAREIVAGLGIELVGLCELAERVPAPVEDAATFEGNARRKAVAYATALARPCLADDSGLEVDALGGAPGVHSAVYAGHGGTREQRDRANRDKLVAELRNSSDENRAARLVCALCLADARGAVLFETRATLEGQILNEPRGGNGFGYDAHLLLSGLGKTVAELSPEELSRRSHRAQAFRALLACDLAFAGP